MTPATFDEPHLRALRARMQSEADPEHAAKCQAYHKSTLQFYGLRAAALRAMMRDTLSRLRGRQATLPLVLALWSSPWFEEREAALLLLQKVARELDDGDLEWLRQLTHGCHGWALLDHLAVHILGDVAMRHGEPVYRQVRLWTRDPWMWTRRAAVLVHVLPARKGQLSGDTAWPTFTELLPEKEFFIRKAIGWALRELCRQYPQEVFDFLAKAGNRASGLTRREGARKLPAEMRIAILGK